MTATDQALTYLLSRARSGIDPDLFVPLLRPLAEGEPVTVAELATASGRSEDTVRQGLAAVPDTEYDDEGRIIGLALTMRPTPHRFTLAGEQLYTWCALDTLFFPALIGKAATIESTSPGSGTVIRVMTGADGTVTSVQPATAVVSIISHPGTGPVRSSFCNQVHYFASREDAQPWLDSHPHSWKEPPDTMTYPRSRRSLSVPRPRHLASALFLAAVMALTTACASSPSGPSAAPGGSSPDAAGAVAVTVSDIDGTTRTIPDGKPAALFFFSAGCGECVEGADSLNKASTALGSSADYLLVDVDPREPKETINGFRDYIKAPELPAVIDTEATLTTRYKVTSISTLVVVDAKGDVTFRATDPSAEKIQEELTKAGAQ